MGAAFSIHITAEANDVQRVLKTVFFGGNGLCFLNLSLIYMKHGVFTAIKIDMTVF
jgi:hypothetical protein